jgi:hypothetical protein
VFRPTRTRTRTRTGTSTNTASYAPGQAHGATDRMIQTDKPHDPYAPADNHAGNPDVPYLSAEARLKLIGAGSVTEVNTRGLASRNPPHVHLSKEL